MRPLSVFLLALCLNSAGFGQRYAIQTIAGGWLPDGEPALGTPQFGVASVTVDKSGMVYFADPNSSSVMRIDASGRLERVAGIGRSGASGDGGDARKARIGEPISIAFDTGENLYIADHTMNRIRMVSGGLITTVAGGDPTTSVSTVRGPAVGAAIGPLYCVVPIASGSFYFLNSSGVWLVKNGILRNLVRQGDPVTGPGAELGERLRINLASRLAVDSAGNVYISQSTVRHRVFRIVDGNVTVFAGSGPSGLPVNGGSAMSSPLNSPGALAFDQQGALYVAQIGVISRIKDGVITNVAGTGVSGFSGDGGPALAAQLGRPTGVHMDGWGRLWIADNTNRRLRVVTEGVIRTVTGGDGRDLDGVPAMGARASFSYVVTTPDGRIYFRENTLHSVYTIEDGIIRRVAGTGVAGYNGDNQDARSAQLRNPSRISTSPEGDLLIADEGNYRIRRVRNGVITTVAGNGQLGNSTVGADATTTPINGVIDVAAGKNGEFYFRVRADKRIWKVASDGLLTHFAGGGTIAPSDGIALKDVDIEPATAMRVAPSGDLYILNYPNDTAGGRILRASGGKLSVVAGGGWAAGGAGTLGPDTNLAYPWVLDIDSAQRIFLGEGGYGRPGMLSVIENRRVYRIAGYAVEDGGGEANFAGDVELPSVIGVAIRADDGIYMADGYGYLRLLTPVGEKCTYSVSPSRIELPATDPSAVVRVDTQPGCPWSAARIENHPPAVMAPLVIDSGQSNTGSGEVRFHGLPNGESERTATLVVAGVDVPVTQLAPPCTYKPDYPGYAASPSYASVKFWLRAPSFCPLAIENTVSWARFIARKNTGFDPSNTGTWEMELTVDSNPGAARAAVIKIAGIPFPVTQAGSVKPVGGTSGTFAHLAAGDSWDTTITLVNRGSTPARVWLSTQWITSQGPPAFRNALKPSESPMVLGLAERELQPGESYILETVTPPTDPLRVGLASVQSDGLVDGFAVFRQSVAGRVQEAVVPLARSPGAEQGIWFDNTAGNVTGVAYARTSEQDKWLDIQVLSPQGSSLAQGSFSYAFNLLHSSFPLAWMIDESFNARGTLRLRGAPAGTMSLIGLRFHPQGAFTTMPSLSTQSGDGAMAHIASGGTWATAVTLVNMGSTPAQARLRVYNPQGQPLAVPWNSLLNPEAAPVADPVLERTLAPGEAWLLETGGPEWEPTKTGWVKLETTAAINGFAVFRQTVGARVQEAVVPLEKGTQQEYAIAFDNGNGYVTGVALANRDSSAREVTATIRDDGGFVLVTEKLTVPALGQISFSTLDRWIITAGRRGTIELAAPVPGGLAMLGLRFHPGGAVTTLPAMAK